MKKLIAISVVFALVAGVAFAVDLGGSISGYVKVIDTEFSDGASVNALGEWKALRLQGAGEAGDGKFGGWFRFDAAGGTFLNNAAAIAWWQPIDQFKLSIGGNPDGLLGQGGFVGWSLNQTANDGIAMGTGNIWGWGETCSAMTRWAFYDGFDDVRLFMEIKPLDLLAINVAIPFFKTKTVPDPDKPGETKEVPEEAAEIYKSLMAQLALNFDFGTIAFTYTGNGNGINSDGSMYLYYGGSFGDLGINFGVGYHLGDALWNNAPLYIGLGAKYSAGAFGIKFRTVAGIPFKDDKDFSMLVDLVPSFAINDNIAIFLNAGIGMDIPKTGNANVGWYINPYLRVGAEWGPTFYAGIQVGNGKGGDGAPVSFSIPIGVQVGF